MARTADPYYTAVDPCGHTAADALGNYAFHGGAWETSWCDETCLAAIIQQRELYSLFVTHATRTPGPSLTAHFVQCLNDFVSSRFVSVGNRYRFGAADVWIK